MNYRLIFNVLGLTLMLEAACLILPMICAIYYGEAELWAFVIASAICLAAGSLLKCIRTKNHRMYAKEGFAMVSLSWIFMSLFGAIPFVISGTIPNYIDALFETVSGFTTTGATILRDVEVLPKSILFWRSFTHWIGGMGVLVFLVSLVKLSGGNNLYLLKAESTGPSVGKLVPKVQATAKILYGIYTTLTVVELVLLLFGGMSFFEAITTAMGTAGTGGFGVRNSSIAGYSSYIQVVVTVFMLIFGVDFSIYYLILIRKFSTAFRSEELRWYLGIVAVSIILICINVVGTFQSVGEALKHSAFQVASIITTTGFATDDFNLWPEFSKVILVLLMFVGACAGSTGGGMKVSRILIATKTIIKELKITAHPKSTHKITINGRMVEHETIRSINVYMIAYFVIFAASLLLISFDNFNFTANFTAVAATINNIGPGLDMVGPTGNFADFSGLSKIIFVLDMLVGRLEVFPMLILFSPYTWKK
ncbi:MAG: TrkH family potassium uptake protein [Ruminococcaceae bacterium]|nr:TrkH family potassium uptake protein [Oscillospiraceae bacterium]